MIDMEETVRLALEDKSPALFRQLQASGQLQAFCKEKADEILEAIVEMTWSSPEVRKAWSPDSRLSPIQKAAIGNSQQAIATEIALATYLEFPQDESPRSSTEDSPPDNKRIPRGEELRRIAASIGSAMSKNLNENVLQEQAEAAALNKAREVARAWVAKQIVLTPTTWPAGAYGDFGPPDEYFVFAYVSPDQTT